MLPYLIAGAIGYGIAKLLEDDNKPKYADGGTITSGEYLIPVKDELTNTGDMNIDNQYYIEVIDGYSDLIEIEDDSEKVEYYMEVIDGYIDLLELNGYDVSEIRYKFEKESEVQPEIQPVGAKTQYSYLMTFDEYKSSEIIPLLQEYRKFVRKNQEYLAMVGWGAEGDYLTYDEAIELGNRSPFYTVPTEKNYASKDMNENITKAFHRRITDYDKKPSNYLNTPKEVVEQNKSFRNKLSVYFPLIEVRGAVQLIIDRDAIKTNKRAIKNAMDDNIYFDLLKSGQLSIERLEEITSSVGVRITKKTYSADKEVEFKEYLKKLKIPQHNFQKLIEFNKQIKSDLESIKQMAYEKEYERYKNNILESIGKTLSQDRLSLLIPFWMFVVDTEKITKRVSRIIAGREYFDTEYEYKVISVKPDWEKQLRIQVQMYVEQLMFKIVATIIDTIKFVKIPFESVKTKNVKIGAKGFEGKYEINFTDGSKFDLNTQGIGAGGYNIQSFHYRYISNIDNIQLPDGQKTKSLDHFIEYIQ